MASNLTDYGATYLAGMFFGGANAAVPTFYVALCYDEPDPSLDGSGLPEVSVVTSPSYARGVYVNNAGNWTIADGTAYNTDVITFPDAAEDWGIVSHYAICDDPLAGNVYAYAGLALPYNVLVGNSIQFDIGLLSFGFYGLRPDILAT